MKKKVSVINQGSGFRGMTGTIDKSADQLSPNSLVEVTFDVPISGSSDGYVIHSAIFYPSELEIEK